MYCNAPTVAWRKIGRKADGTRYAPFYFHPYESDADVLDYYNNCPPYAEPLILPCGKCLLCTCAYRRHWILRCLHEMRFFDKGIFLTLTVSDDHLDEVFPSLSSGAPNSLRHKPFQDYVKRLRIVLTRSVRSDYIRYYMCGEYGDLHHRPHYHAIIYGYMPDDLKALIHHKGLYVSDEVAKLWPYGYHTIAPITAHDISYVAGYVDKKLYIRRDEYISSLGVAPEYTAMSRGSVKRGDGGLGYRFFVRYRDSDLYPENADGTFARLFALTSTNLKVRMPRYYDQKLLLRDPAKHARLLTARQVGAAEHLSGQDVGEWLRRCHAKHEIRLTTRRARDYKPASDL